MDNIIIINKYIISTVYLYIVWTVFKQSLYIILVCYLYYLEKMKTITETTKIIEYNKQIGRYTIQYPTIRDIIT